MVRSSKLLVLASAAAAVAGLFGCGSSSSAPSGAAIGVAGQLPPGLTATLSFERRLPAASTEAPSAALIGRIAGAALRDAVLLAPDRRTYAFAAGADGALEVRIDAADDADLIARFPPGLYTIDMVLVDGSRRSLGISVRGGFPAFPEAIDPADGETGVAPLPTIVFEGTAPRFDVAVVDAGTGARIVLATGTELRTASPGAPLARGRAWLLEIAGATGPVNGIFRFASVRESRFETAP